MTNRTAIKAMAPLITVAAMWGTHRGLNYAYKRRTGQQPPTRDDLDTPLRTIVTWTLVSVVTSAMVDVAIQQTLARIIRSQSEPAVGSAA